MYLRAEPTSELLGDPLGYRHGCHSPGLGAAYLAVPFLCQVLRDLRCLA